MIVLCGFQKLSARIDDQLITRSDDGYVAVTLPRDEPNWRTRDYFLRYVLCQALQPLQNQIGDRRRIARADVGITIA